jgi:uncharacterized zinc-type alcohol dehydrogenase-like protein
MPSSHGYAALDAQSPLAPFSFTRREPGPTEIAIEILYCGVCHSDLHMARNEWGQSVYPMVPGHEIVGRVIAAGNAVTKFKVGDIAAIGVIVDSCRQCAPCHAGEEHFCEGRARRSPTPQGPRRRLHHHGRLCFNYVVDERFAHTVPENLNLAAVAPLLCAGITTYSPLRHWKVGPARRSALSGSADWATWRSSSRTPSGAHVVQFTTNLRKKEDALKLGADEVVLSSDPDAMKAHTKSFDFILDTVSPPAPARRLSRPAQAGRHDVLVGLPDKPPNIQRLQSHGRRSSIAGSMIGGMPETQEMLDYCGKHNIVSEVEVIPSRRSTKPSNAC